VIYKLSWAVVTLPSVFIFTPFAQTTIFRDLDQIMTKTVITYGTFDMFHIGHLRLIRRLQELGERVIVAVSTDEFNLEKGKRVVIPFSQRVEIVSAISGVNLVIAESSWDQKVTDIEKYGVDTFAMGDDWAGKFDFLNEYCEVIYLERTVGVSTTELKSSLKNILSVPKEEIIKALEVLEILRQDFE
jgi:glycerol-3-phosphate cytidylyltransferase